jgi:hypothetical protein
MTLESIGPHPFELDEQDRQIVRIATSFLDHEVLYTFPPGFHAWQRASFIESINTHWASDASGPLNLHEDEKICHNSVDLILDSSQILTQNPGSE